MEKADRIITRLSDLLRTLIEGSGRQQVALKEEIRTIEAYLEIMQARFEDQLTASVDVAAEAAQTIEAKRETWDKLRLEMLDDLGERQRQLDEMKRTLSAFLESSEGLVRHVMSTRY